MRRLAVALLALLVCLGVLEGLLRLGLIDNPKFNFREMRSEWSTSAHRVLILGDSFVEPGAGLALALDHLLSEEQFAVRNLAVGGTGPFEYLERLKGFARSDEQFPDTVLLSYYVGNDLTDVQNNPKFKPERRGTAIRTELPKLWRLPSETWYDATYTAHFVRKSLAKTPRPQRPPLRWRELELAGHDPELIQDAKNSKINAWLFTLSKSNPNYLLDNILMETDENRAAWERGQLLLSKISELCAKRGAKLIVVAFPRSVQIDDSHFDFFGRLKFNLDERLIGSTVPQDLLTSFCGERQIPLLDLLPALKAPTREALYLEKDDHLNPAGNQLAAELIVPWVIEQTE